MKKIIPSICVLVLLLGGCYANYSSPGLSNCPPPTRYLFNQFGTWLHAGSNAFDVSDPTNPTLYLKDTYYGGDTIYTLGRSQYLLSGSFLTFDSIPRSYYNNFSRLGAIPTHLAASSNLLYLLRHIDTSGTVCTRRYDTINALEVKDISKDTATTMYRTLLRDPQDIAIIGSTLYVLDGMEGLKIFSIAADAQHPTLLATMSNITGYHMDLTQQQTLIVHSANGLTQYDVSNPTAPALLAKIQ
jgi:hypothetical protein